MCQNIHLEAFIPGTLIVIITRNVAASHLNSHDDEKYHTHTFYQPVIKYLVLVDHCDVMGEPIQHTRALEMEAFTFTFITAHITAPNVHDDLHLNFKINMVNRL